MPNKLVRLLSRKKPGTLQERFPQFSIGKGSYGPLRVYDWGEGATLRIGAYCSIAEGSKILLGGGHRTDWVTTYPFEVFLKSAKHVKGTRITKGDVNIGNDVWLGMDSMIMSGVTVGDGAVIGASAVVTKDIPPYAIVAGNPVRVVRMRFDDTVIDKLLEIQWWNWSDSRIERLVPLLMNNDLEAFLDAAEACVEEEPV